jgi:hypothetical protein
MIGSWREWREYHDHRGAVVVVLDGSATRRIARSGAASEFNWMPFAACTPSSATAAFARSDTGRAGCVAIELIARSRHAV